MKRTITKKRVPKKKEKSTRVLKKRSVKPSKKGMRQLRAKKMVKNARKGRKMQALVHADDDRAFWVSRGPVLHNLRELHDALGVISDEQYFFHVRKDQNDFAKWVEEILVDAICAKELKRAKDKKTARVIITKRLKFYTI